MDGFFLDERLMEITEMDDDVVARAKRRGWRPKK